ncbi:MAG TPA: hypothetical protein VHS13_04090, partial [Edaphobacter sp.]|nr:hypothetical protein [Edaphobacter sp.]
GTGLEKEINFGYRKKWLKIARSLYCEDLTMDIGQRVEIFPNTEALARGEGVGWRAKYCERRIDGFETVGECEGAICFGTAVPQADASAGT